MEIQTSFFSKDDKFQPFTLRAENTFALHNRRYIGSMRACLEVNLKALKHNVKILSKEAGNSFFCPIIKANAYGHGALEVAKALHSAGIKQAGVVSIEEALQLYPISQEMTIYILGPFYKDQIPWFKLYGFIPIVGDWDSLKALANFANRNNQLLPFHLKFNTGMNRFGFSPSEKSALLQSIQKYPYLKLKGLASHLSEGEKAGSQKEGSALQQIRLFKQICAFFKTALPRNTIDVHLLNSAGWVALWCHGRTKELSWGFRPGISLYGIKPPVEFLTRKAKERYHALDLKSVACLKAFVVQSYKLKPNQRVSYGGKWKSRKKSTLAVVSMGYADGLPYRLFKEGEVLFRGERVSIAGHICMDFFMIDVTQQALKGEIKKGEEVVIFGQQKKALILVQEQTEKAGSIPEEFLTRIGPRVQKIFNA